MLFNQGFRLNRVLVWFFFIFDFFFFIFPWNLDLTLKVPSKIVTDDMMKYFSEKVSLDIFFFVNHLADDSHECQSLFSLKNNDSKKIRMNSKKIRMLLLGLVLYGLINLKN